MFLSRKKEVGKEREKKYMGAGAPMGVSDGRIGPSF
jgi:hypothetical protein